MSDDSLGLLDDEEQGLGIQRFTRNTIISYRLTLTPIGIT